MRGAAHRARCRIPPHSSGGQIHVAYADATRDCAPFGRRFGPRAIPIVRKPLGGSVISKITPHPAPLAATAAGDSEVEHFRALTSRDPLNLRNHPRFALRPVGTCFASSRKRTALTRRLTRSESVKLKAADSGPFEDSDFQISVCRVDLDTLVARGRESRFPAAVAATVGEGAQRLGRNRNDRRTSCLVPHFDGPFSIFPMSCLPPLKPRKRDDPRRTSRS